eukprot:m.179374 g.179374  ORF g.179374 m.179374 type:complete len:744 (+) comp10458_c0_seq5:1397-3628(+)
MALRRRKGTEDSTSAGTDALQDDDKKKPHSTPATKAAIVEEPIGWLLVALVTLVGACLRFWGIHSPAEVVFDEVHFGRFAYYYAEREFFFDVHPPLAKMILALGALFGPRNGFGFSEISLAYPQDLPFGAMRMVVALFGTLHIPLVFVILRRMKCTNPSALLGSVLVAFDNALVTQSRFILLDAIMIFFILASLLAMLEFQRRREQSFSGPWWGWLLATGVALGCTLSCKFVGVFVVLVVGLYTALDLWDIIGDMKVPSAVLWRHFYARILGLVMVPLAVYVLFFGIHLAVLSSTGPDALYLSPGFQATLQGHARYSAQIAAGEVGLGSTVTIRLQHDQPCFLHSHPHEIPIYPAGDGEGLVSSNQQQVNCLPGQEPQSGSRWKILAGDPEAGESPNFQPIRNGDVVRFRHIDTGKMLNSHDVAAPITQYTQEVTCYGSGDERAPPGDPDHLPSYDQWQIELLGSEHSELAALRTLFRLRHVETGAYLMSTHEVLPEWGFSQYEVSTAQDKSYGATVWRIETQSNPKSPKAKRAPPRAEPLPFWSQFIEYHLKQFEVNNGLTDEHVYASRPGSWFLLHKGQSYWQGATEGQIYLLGNPPVWFMTAGCLGLFVVLSVFYVLRRRRDCHDLSAHALQRLNWGWLAVVGWAFHYLPFFLMGRQLFFHHYLPAFVLSSLVVPVVIEHVALSMFRSSFLLLLTVLLVTLAALLSFAYFAPFTYGIALELEHIDSRQWRKSWDFQHVWE